MPITVPVGKAPKGRAFLWGVEDVTAGTPPAGGTTHPVFQDQITDFAVTDSRVIHTDESLTGTMTGNTGRFLLTEYVQATLTGMFRGHGIFGRALAQLHGSQDETPVGTGAPYVHTIPIAPLTNRTNTNTCWYRYAYDATTPANYLRRFTRATFTSMDLTFGPGSSLDVSATLYTQWGSHVAPPTVDKYIGGDAVYVDTPTMGNQGTFTIMSSSGAQYSPRVLSGTLHFERAVEPEFAADNTTIVDITLGSLEVTGTLVMEFDGFAAQTLATDYENFVKTGTFANPNKIRFTDSDGNYFEFASYFWSYEPWTPDFSGQKAKGTATWSAEPDRSKYMSPTPVLSVSALTMRNNIAAQMVFS